MSDNDLRMPLLVRQQELISQIAAGIASDTQGPWSTIAYGAKVLFPYSQDLVRVTTPDGQVVAEYPPDETSRLVRELRELMYRHHLGTWFTFTLTISRQGGADAAFDYDNEPAWSHRAEPVFYVQDLERFPRDDAHIPEWLAHELALGRDQDAEYDKSKGPRKRITPIIEAT